jgi:hypothetical protein
MNNADLAVCFPIVFFSGSLDAVQRLPHSVLSLDAVPGNCGSLLSKDCAASVFAVRGKKHIPSKLQCTSTEPSCHVPQDHNPNIQRCNNFKSHIVLVLATVGPKYLPESCCTFRELNAGFGIANVSDKVDKGGAWGKSE